MPNASSSSQGCETLRKNRLKKFQLGFAANDWLANNQLILEEEAVKGSERADFDPNVVAVLGAFITHLT